MLAVFILFSCVSTGEAVQKSGAADRPMKATAEVQKVYNGSGQDASLLGAMTKAKMDAVRKAVIAMIGESKESTNRAKLEQVLYNTKNPNAFVKNDTMNTLRKDNAGTIDNPNYIIEISIEVDLAAVENTLKAQGLWGTENDKVVREQAAKESSRTADAKPQISEDVEAKKEDWGEPTPEEAKIIRRYVDTMTYMVYFNQETTKTDPFFMKAAVNIANQFLTSKTMETVDPDQIEKLKEDRKLAFEEETGTEVTLLQWIAQKLNADVYIEIDAVTQGESVGGKHYGSANVTLKAFEPSTGRLLGSQPFNSPKAFNQSSQREAIINALQSSIYKAMPIVIDQAKAYMQKALARGIKYEVIIQKTPDSKVMSDFRRKLQRKVKEVKTVDSSREETKYEVYIIGTVEDLEDAIYDVAETVPGLENLDRVYMRGKSITFNTGL